MANKRIVDLIAAGALNLTDLFEIDSAGSSLKLTAQQIIDLARGQLLGVAIPVHTVNAGNMVNSTTYYFGMDSLSGVQTVFQNAAVRIPKSGTIKATFFKWSISNPGSGETVPHSIRINDAADTLLNNATLNSTRVDVYSANVNIPVNQNDQFVLKVATPAWATPPVGALVQGYIYIE